MPSLADFVDRAQIAALRRPIKEASGLPAVVYTSEAFFELERKTLLPKQWMAVAYGHEIPEAGDAMPLKVLGLPVMLVRGADGSLRAFHNVCRHRGTMVLKEPVKRAKTLRCPYHSWTYDLEGNLRARPLWDGREDPAEDRLVSIPCREWVDIVYLNLSGDAEPFEDYFGFLSERWKPYDFDALQACGSREWEVATNWKLFALGVVEPYHEPFIHPQIVKIIEDPETGAKKMDNDTFDAHLEKNCIGVVTPIEDRDFDLAHGLPFLPGPPEGFKRNMDIFLMFPTGVVVLARDHILNMIATPTAADKMRVKVALYASAEAVADPKLNDARAALFDDWVEIMEQDIEALTLQLEGHRSPIADQAKFSPFWESSAHYFEKHVVDLLEKG
ncbi:MAG: aromatic ring-hydroxylating dioxygenase subunit alpha [Proteobacteria bacterium]|nr:aromatic ring-hydroxylating dioxygenase subunit alpha [Pseudomonadota bacterium]